MTSLKKTLLGMTLAVACVGFVVACDSDEAPTTPAPAQPNAESAAALPSSLFLEKAPAGAVELAVAKKSAKPGDEITVRGSVGGQVEPLAPNRAILTLLDSSATTFDQLTGDVCKTP